MAPQLEIGPFRITLVRAGSYWWDGGAMFGVVPRTLWGKHNSFDELNRVEAGFNCFVVDDGAQRCLIETGGGVRHDERSLERMNMTRGVHAVEALAEAGFAAESIHVVINTHLHWDHCGGNTVDTSDGAVPAFPKARYIVQRGELDHALEQHPRDAVSYRGPNYLPLAEANCLDLLDGEAEVAPGIRVQVAPGHNRDMSIVIVEAGDETWCHLADLAPYAAHITPTWVAAFDLFPLQTIQTKTEIFTRAASEGWWVSFAHDPKVSFARIENSGGKFGLRDVR